MSQLFWVLLDTLFPPSEEELVLRHWQEGKDYLDYNPTIINFVTALMSYKNPQVKAVIKTAKFNHNNKAFLLLAEILEKHMAATGLHNYVLVPIPLAPKRWRKRGYNQVEKVLSQTNLPYRTDLLKRVRNTKPQTSLDRGDRLKNMHNAFKCKVRKLPSDMQIVLLDDVYTTGATMEAARATLAPLSPLPIICIALAH
ncbi:hypothetical protein CL653_01700 [bacterium]|nr:hypothetical protein [bacterium]|tara:strand:- start:88 stop:681 length:594 start_codon:yes stop_codon:yes gene_type:complete